MTNVEVLRLWQHHKGFDNVPGFSSLDPADRAQVQQTFKALLASTPVQAQGMMRNKLIRAAAAAGGMHQPMAISNGSPTIAGEYVPQRQPSNDAMMMESSASPPAVMDTPLIISHASGNFLPQGAPQLHATPSVLASYLSNLSCSTPTNVFLPPASAGPQQPSNLLSPSFGMAHRPIYRELSNTSNSSSPALLPRHAPRDRSISPFDNPWNTGTPSSAAFPASAHTPLHLSHQPPSPHSNHTSPVPFASMHIPLRPFGTGLQHQQPAQPQPHQLALPVALAPAALRIHKRKLGETIPEEEFLVHPGVADPPLQPYHDPDAMDDGAAPMNDEEIRQESKKRRTGVRSAS